MTGSPHTQCAVTPFTTFADNGLERRVRAEFLEMPGMRLTLEQAMRMWDIDRDTCSRLLESLITARFLERDRSGRYRRAHAGY